MVGVIHVGKVTSRRTASMAGKACFLSFNLEVFPPKVAHFSIWPSEHVFKRVTTRASRAYWEGKESVTAVSVI